MYLITFSVLSQHLVLVIFKFTQNNHFALIPFVAALLCVRPVVSWSRSLDHHLHLHPVPAPEKGRLYGCPAEELPLTGPARSSRPPACLLHLPPHCNQVPLYFQPARPLEHIPGDDTLKCNLRLMFLHLSIKD